MRGIGKSFSPGKSELFWCQNCNSPLLSERCYSCKSTGRQIRLSPPADVRLCSAAGRELLESLFSQNYGYAEFLKGRIILLNKIAGIDRRDQVILDGYHIATLWFDITTATYRLDLEPGGAALLAEKAKKGVVVCRDKLLKGHIKGKWLRQEQIESQPEDLEEGDNVILKIGKFAGVGVARWRRDGSRSIRIKDVTGGDFHLSGCLPTLDAVVLANQDHLKDLEKAALRELKDYLSRSRLPVNVSFSGGKDSLASLCLCRKVKPQVDVLFVNTGLEFPETVTYVREFCHKHKLKLQEIRGEDSFFEQVKSFGPPAKDFRWCCKTNKLGPMASFIQKRYSKGCVTIEGRRIYESFNRALIKAVERNPYVPSQTTLSPIRSWRALEVVLYIHWNKLDQNPLYEQDFERIGCWLCPASLQSEFTRLKNSHPHLHAQWSSCLEEWAKENKLENRYVDWGFWRWKRHPPKMLELAKAHHIDLKIKSADRKKIALQIVRGRSPCGLDYSIEATFSTPQNHAFPAVAGALGLLGDMKYAEDLGAVVIKTGTGRVTIFANGHLLIVAPEKEAEELLAKSCETILRVQMCTRCKICEKNCPRGAIAVKETIIIDEKKCDRCGKCAEGCIAADQAAKILRDLDVQNRSPCQDAI